MEAAIESAIIQQMETDEKGEGEAKPYYAHGLRRTWYATRKGERYPDAFRTTTPSPVQATPIPLFADAPQLWGDEGRPRTKRRRPL